jgi:GT2 family glycosyltransferase
MAARFSVLLCTYNRHELLAQSLRALVERTAPPPDQVVVVNGGDERADGAVRQFIGVRPGVQVQLVKTVNKNLAASRNVGLPHCAGEIVAMTDDDSEVYPDWIAQIQQTFAAHPEAGAVGGAVIGTHPESFLSRLADQVTFSSPNQPQLVRTLPGVNVAYRRRALEKIGAQDEALFRGEDVDFNWRLQKAGYIVWYDPAIKVLHHHRPTPRGFFNQHYMYGRAYYLVRRKWPEMYCVYPHRLQRPQDVLKALNFVAAAFYEPLFAIRRLARWSDRLLAYPVLLLNQLVWRGGMVRQRLLEP